MSFKRQMNTIIAPAVNSRLRTMKTQVLLSSLGLFGFLNCPGVVITSEPADQSASLFADVTFSVEATSSSLLSYQWQFNAIPISGAVSNSLLIADIQKTNAGAYSVIVSDSLESRTSRVATLTISRFNSVYCFGHSWTDTHGNFPNLQYWNGRSCNGPMWPEFLSTNLGLPYNSANNYAVGGATSSDQLNQVSTFTAPSKPQLSVYFLWGGGAELLQALPHNNLPYGFLDVTNEVAWDQLIQTVALNNSNTVDRLYSQRARSIVLLLCADLSKLPLSRLQFGPSTGLLTFSQYIARLNSQLVTSMSAYQRTKPDLRLILVDVFSKLNSIIAQPTSYGFTISTTDALDDLYLSNKSFTGPGADYVFWDNRHPTSKLHELMSRWCLEALTNSALEQVDLSLIGGAPNIQMEHLQIGGDYTLQSSEDFKQWQNLQAFTALNGASQWSGPPDGETNAFYKLKRVQ